MTEYRNTSTDDSIYLQKFFAYMGKRWYWFVLSLSAALMVTYFLFKIQPRKYHLSMELIERRDEFSEQELSGMMGSFTSMRDARNQLLFEKEVAILKSSELARLSLKELPFSISYFALGRRQIASQPLYKNGPFYITFPDSSAILYEHDIYITFTDPRHYKVKIDDGLEIAQEMTVGETFNKKNIVFKLHLYNAQDFQLNTNYSNSYYFRVHRQNKLVRTYQRKLQVHSRSGSGNIMQLSMTGASPIKIAIYLNTLAEEYLKHNLREKNQQAINSVTFIDEQLSILEDSLRRTEYLLNLAKSNLPGNQLQDLTQSLSKDYRNLTEQEMQINLQVDYLTKLLRQIDSTQLAPIYLPSLIGSTSEQFQNLISQLNQLSLDIRAAQKVAQPASLHIRQLQEKHEGALLLLRNYLAEAKKSKQQQLEQIRAERQQLDQSLALLPNRERNIVRIERKLAMHDQMYTFLMEKKAELGIRRSANSPDYAILEPCHHADARLIAPNGQQFYLIGSLIGLLTPALIMLLLQLTNKKITDLYDLRNLASIPVLGHLSHNKYPEEIPVITYRKSKFAESFRTLKANLQFMRNGSSRKVLAVTSSISGEGKTFCAVNLAAVMAQSGERTLLIGLDLRKPRLYKICQLNNKKGLSTYLTGQSERDEIIQPSGTNHLDVVVAGPVPPNPAELMESEKLFEFMAFARNHYDNIVIDTPPVALVADVILLRKIIDVALYVVRFNYSHKDVLHLVEELNEKGIFQLTMVVNDIMETKNYNYHRRYSYGYYGSGDDGYYEEHKKSKKSSLLQFFGATKR